MFEYFYNEILRKTVIGFGTLFNNITIKHLDGDNKTVSVMKVPLAYGPIQKFLARIEQAPDLKNAQTLTLPRLSFEFTGLSYDPSRKVTQTQTFLSAPTSDKAKAKKVYMPVPYNMTFELNMIAKLNDDALQIVEQILPYFQPSYNLTINLLSSIGEKRDVPIVLDNVSFTDDYEGDFSERRALIYTLTFTVKTYLNTSCLSGKSFRYSGSHTAQFFDVDIFEPSKFKNSLAGTLLGSINFPCAFSIEGKIIQ